MKDEKTRLLETNNRQTAELQDSALFTSLPNANSTFGRTVIGEVVSACMDKTLVVAIVQKVPHPKYGKYIKRRTKLFAHDPGNVARLSERVLIRAHRPISKHKHWLLVKVLDSSNPC